MAETTTCTPAAHAPAPPGTGPCPHCDMPRCNGTTSSGRCRKQPIKGGAVCRTHGGSAPQVKAAAEARLLHRRAVLEAETLGLPREIDPHTALLEELHRTAGAVQWLAAVISDLERGHVAGDSVWLRLYADERDRLVKVAKTCVDVGIEERRVRLAESAGAQLAAVVRAVLDRLQLSDEQRLLALQVVPEEFRRLGDVVPGEVVEDDEEDPPPAGALVPRRTPPKSGPGSAERDEPK